MSHRLGWVVAIIVLSSGIAAIGWKSGCTSVHRLQLVAFICACLSLLWVCFGAATTIFARRRKRYVQGPTGTGVPHFFFVSALLFAVVPAVAEAIILVMRVVYVSTDLVLGAPSFVPGVYGYGPDGLWSFGALALSCSVGLAVTGDRRLGTALAWIVASAVVWGCLLGPVFRTTDTESIERTGGSAGMVVGLALLLLAAVVTTEVLELRRRWRLAQAAPEQLATPSGDWPGMRPSATAVTTILLVLVAYHVVVPAALWPGAVRRTMLLVALSGLVAGGSAFAVLGRSWGGHLADAAAGLISLSLTALVVCIVPVRTRLLAEHYPAVFRAIMIGLAMACALWTWLSDVWKQQLEGGVAWTTAGRLIPHAERFAFVTAVLAVMVAGLAALWPRLPGISATDDTLGAVLSGLFSNLFLLLVVLWSSRRLGWRSFHALVPMAAVTTLVFVVVRLLPFASSFG